METRLNGWQKRKAESGKRNLGLSSSDSKARSEAIASRLGLLRSTVIVQ